MRRSLVATIPSLCAATALALSCATQARVQASPREEGQALAATLGLEDLQADYDYLIRSVLVLNPLVNADRPRLEALIAVQRSKLAEGMGSLDFFRLATPVVSALGCGHSYFPMPQETAERLLEGGSFLPFEAQVIGGRILAAKGAGLPPGSELLSINGRGSAEIIAALAEHMSADGRNLTKKYRDMSRRFSELYYLFLGSEPSFSVEYLAPGGGTESVELAAISREDLEALSQARGIGPVRLSDSPLQGSFPERDLGLLRVASFAYYDSDSAAAFKAFIDDFFEKMSEQGTGSLVLDLRGNGGGDPWASSWLFRYLIDEPLPYFAEGTAGYYDLEQPLEPAKNAFRGRLVTLVDGDCFSSTGHFCALLKYHGIGTLVGEETGGGFACTDRPRQLSLNRVGLVLNCSTREYAVAVSGMERGRGVMPDIEVLPSAQELLAERDVPMERALALLAAP